MHLLLATAVLVAALPARDDEARRLVFLIEYLSTDYRVAISERIEPELVENERNARDAVELYDRLRPGGALHAELEALAGDTAHRATADSVEARGARLVPLLRRELGVDTAPLLFPDLGPGRAVFASNCARCHGEGGRGDGPDARALSPRPPDMTAPAWADHRAPAQLFDTIAGGVPGTAMPPWENALDAQTRWSLAFYLLTLTPRRPPPAPPPWIGVSELSVIDNSGLAKRIEGVPAPDALAMADAARRAPVELPLADAVSRLRRASEKASELVARGERDEAGTLIRDTYFDAIEPAEEALERAAPGSVPELEIQVNAVRDAIPGGDAGPALAGLMTGLDALRVRLPAPPPPPPDRPLTGSLVLAALAMLAAVRLLSRP